MKHTYYLLKIAIISLFIVNTGCRKNNIPSTYISVFESVEMYPDYTDLTIPYNIAPLNFMIEDVRDIIVQYKGNKGELVVSGKKKIDIPVDKWKKLVNQHIGDTLFISVFAKKGKDWINYPSFYYYVSPEAIDPYVAYRLIPPGFDEWNHMGLYQRNIETFREKPIIKNTSTKKNCMNCHTFRQNNPEKMVFHMRHEYPGTYLIQNDKIDRLNTKTDYTISNCVYPYWHPSGKYIAFSTNATAQSLHIKPDLNIEVYDMASDIVVLDIENNTLFTDSLLNQESAFETYPAFSPDGKTLYFCTSEKVDKLPQKYDRIKYSLCSIGFDIDNKTFNNKIDTLISSEKYNKSVTFAHPSFDGKYIICTLADYGCFPSWNKESDLYLYDLTASELRPLSEVNSPYSEGFTSWSANSKWFVFSSRRNDQQYNRLYFSHIDNEGNSSKAFVLPQKDPEHNILNLYAYNKPEFMTSDVKISPEKIAEVARRQKSEQVGFQGSKQIDYDIRTPQSSVN